MNFNALAKLRRYLEVRHHVPGRIRIVFRPAIADEPLVRELMGNGADLPPGVRSARVNVLARSVVIEYDAHAIPPAMLEDLVNADDERAARLLRELDAILRNMDRQEVQ